MWVKKDWPWIPGYDELGDTVSAKRWQGFSLKELISLDLDDLCRFYALGEKVLQTRKDVCDFVISDFDYPLVHGQPCDRHLNNWFQGLCKHQISQDFWQFPGDTLQTLALNQRLGKKGYGDCEDTSSLFTALFLLHGWDAWLCFGQVFYKGGVGDHAWALFLDDHSAPRIYESTLDVPPPYSGGYPMVNLNTNVWNVSSAKYVASIKLRKNPDQYYEWDSGGTSQMGIEEYLKLKFKTKETREKFKAIAKAWGINTKPLAKLSLLSKLRWR